MVTENFLTPDGTKHAQKKQMEIVQARTSSGTLQVVRAQTVQAMSSRTTSSTSNSISSSSTTAHHHHQHGSSSSSLFSQPLSTSTSRFLFGNTSHNNSSNVNTTLTGERNYQVSPISLNNLDVGLLFFISSFHFFSLFLYLYELKNC